MSEVLQQKSDIHVITLVPIVVHVDFLQHQELTYKCNIAFFPRKTDISYANDAKLLDLTADVVVAFRWVLPPSL